MKNCSRLYAQRKKESKKEIKKESKKKVKSNFSSPWVNLAFTVFYFFFLPPIQLIWMTQFFIVLKAYNHGVYVNCMRDVFSNKRSKKAMLQCFWVWYLKLNQQDTWVSYNKDSVIQRWAEKRKKLMKTKKARQTTNWICFSFLQNKCS